MRALYDRFAIGRSLRQLLRGGIWPRLLLATRAEHAGALAQFDFA